MGELQRLYLLNLPADEAAEAMLLEWAHIDALADAGWCPMRVRNARVCILMEMTTRHYDAYGRTAEVHA